MTEATSSDVSLSDDPNSRVRVGVLSFHNSKETKAILNAVRALGHEPVWLREENTRTWTADGTLHFDPDVDVVANRLLTTKARRPLEDLGIASSYAAARPVLNAPATVMRAMHKFGAAATLSAAGLPVPDAYMAFDHRTVNDTERPLDGRTVHKPAIGTNGARMSLQDSNEPVSPRIARRRAFLQEFLDADSDRPFDVRVYVVGDRIVGAMKRYAPRDEWRTNVALGGAVEGITDRLQPEAAQLARQATSVLGLDYAGVDLLVHDGEWYVLEVNATAGFKGLYDATGISPAPHIARLAIERVDGSVDSEQLDTLASILDDSVPDCKPTDVSDLTSTGTVGFTERVTVAADRGVERVIAKSDTGAKRTCIDIELAAKIGAGPIVGTVTVKSGTRRRRKRPLVDLELEIDGQWYQTTASIENRDHLEYEVLLGRDVLENYRVDVGRTLEE